MKKSTRQLLIITIVMVFLFIMLFFTWRLSTQNQSFNSNIAEHTPDNVNNEIRPTDQSNKVSPPKILSAEEILHHPYLSLTQKILTQIDSQADSRGIHGSVQDCEKNANGQFDCQIRMLDFLSNGTLYAHHRHALTLIWAKYRYYLQTGDEKIFTSLKNDIDSYIKILDSDVWVTQTNRFNCALMSELVDSPYLSSDYQNKIKRFCQEVGFEMHPDSLVAYSQYEKKPFGMIDLASLANNQRDYETTVQIDENRVINPEKRINYKSEQLITEITQDLESFYYKEPIKSQNNISEQEQERFINRELIAAIDQVGAMKLYENNQDKYNERLIDYLLLTKETLTWFSHNPGRYGADIHCLLFENINYFINNFAHTLTADQKKLFQEKRVTNASFMTDGMFYCFFAKEFLAQEQIDKQTLVKEVQEKNKQAGTTSWEAGYLQSASTLASFGSYYYDIEINSLLAGLLAK